MGSHAAAESAELERFHSDLGEGGGASSEAAAASPDAPILAAIRSHNSGLDEVEAKTAKLEAEAGNYIRQSGLKHAAELLEVSMTDQLLQLTQMLDDCVTADWRAAVKVVVARLRSLGARLRPLAGSGR